jgi:hypothetical protein
MPATRIGATYTRAAGRARAGRVPSPTLGLALVLWAPQPLEAPALRCHGLPDPAHAAELAQLGATLEALATLTPPQHPLHGDKTQLGSSKSARPTTPAVHGGGNDGERPRGAGAREPRASGTHRILMLDMVKMSEYSTFICRAMTLWEEARSSGLFPAAPAERTPRLLRPSPDA